MRLLSCICFSVLSFQDPKSFTDPMLCEIVAQKWTCCFSFFPGAESSFRLPLETQWCLIDFACATFQKPKVMCLMLDVDTLRSFWHGFLTNLTIATAKFPRICEVQALPMLSISVPTFWRHGQLYARHRGLFGIGKCHTWAFNNTVFLNTIVCTPMRRQFTCNNPCDLPCQRNI